MKKKKLTPEEQLQRSLLQLKNYRPLDDDFMRALFRRSWNLTELVLKIITGIEDLVLTKQETQYDLKRLGGSRAICLDAFGTDTQGRWYDLEVQRADEGAKPERARYHASAMDVEALPAGEDFDKLPITYVIFITENDVFGGGKAVYEIERTIKNYSHIPFADGSHILFVNGSYVGDDDIGKLMHDFRCTNADDMYYEWMARATRYYKETPEGVSYMCKAMEDRIKENVQIAYVEMASKMLTKGTYTFDEIAELTGLSLEEIQQLADEQNESN